MTIDNPESRERTRKALGLGLLLSILVHIVLLVVLGPLWVRRDLEPLETAEVEDQEEELIVETTYEEPTPQRPLEPEIVEKPPEPRPPEPPKPEEKEPEKIESKVLDRKVVDQDTNEEVPEEAEYLSTESNRVLEETRARKTTTDPAHKPEPNEEKREVEKSSEEIASIDEAELDRRRQPEPQPPDEPRPQETEREVNERAGRDPVIVKKRPPPRELLIPDATSYERMFARRDKAVREHSEANRPRKRLFEGYEELNGEVKASLENFIHEVQPGNHTGVNAHKSVYAEYIGRIHRKIHLRWANRYLMDLDMYEPRGSPMNDPKLNTKLEFVIRAEDGELESVNIVSGSGQTRFDAQALSIAYAIGPHPNPPLEIVSPNGRVYIHWNFWRDQRQCGTFGASVFLVNTDEG
jgi:hypothetical protein